MATGSNNWNTSCCRMLLPQRQPNLLLLQTRDVKHAARGLKLARPGVSIWLFFFFYCLPGFFYHQFHRVAVSTPAKEAESRESWVRFPDEPHVWLLIHPSLSNNVLQFIINSTSKLKIFIDISVGCLSGPLFWSEYTSMQTHGGELTLYIYESKYNSAPVGDNFPHFQPLR